MIQSKKIWHLLKVMPDMLQTQWSLMKETHFQSDYIINSHVPSKVIFSQHTRNKEIAYNDADLFSTFTMWSRGVCVALSLILVDHMIFVVALRLDQAKTWSTFQAFHEQEHWMSCWSVKNVIKQICTNLLKHISVKNGKICCYLVLYCNCRTAVLSHQIRMCLCVSIQHKHTVEENLWLFDLQLRLTESPSVTGRAGLSRITSPSVKQPKNTRFSQRSAGRGTLEWVDAERR